MAHGVLPEAHNMPQGTHSAPQVQLAVATEATDVTVATCATVAIKATRAKGPQGSGA